MSGNRSDPTTAEQSTTRGGEFVNMAVTADRSGSPPPADDVVSTRDLSESRLEAVLDEVSLVLLTIRDLEWVGDHAERVAGVADRLSAPPDDDLPERIDDLGGRSRSIVDGTVRGVLEDDDGRVEALVDDLTALDRTLYEMAGEDAYLLSDVHDGPARTAAHGRNVAELARRR